MSFYFNISCILKKLIINNYYKEVVRMPKYGKAAQKKVEKTMHEFKRGKLHSGKSGKIVKGRKQAIAIGLSQARKRGAKVPKRK